MGDDMNETIAAPILRVDYSGVVISATGESWLVGDSQGAYPLTPPFLFRRPRTSSIPAAKNLALHLIDAHKVMGVEEFKPTPEQWELIRKLRWCVPVWDEGPDFQREAPVVYLSCFGGLEQFQKVVSRIQELSALTRQSITPLVLRGGTPTVRLVQSNIQPVVFINATHHQQSQMRNMEANLRRSSLVWVTRDLDLIVSTGSLRVSAEDFLADSEQLLAAGYNPFGFIKWWAMRWYEREQFGLPLPYAL